MTIKALKKLQLLTVSLFILTIIIITIGLILIGISNYYDYVQIDKNSKLILRQIHGFKLLNILSMNYILIHSPSFICYFTENNNNYNNWIQLQIGIIFCYILVPILTIITISLTFFIIGLKVKIKNNNFWDAIANCEIISNYYVH
ncbi:hypothetical protein [Spiroplasma endosymbiont of Panzeria rudis]|uniref:hypothetical protein n=1 Tax=Spiroplasma endosymbiont of Panzeria rudis TaxID=3066301 RepID=UPI0030D1D8FA